MTKQLRRWTMPGTSSGNTWRRSCYRFSGWLLYSWSSLYQIVSWGLVLTEPLAVCAKYATWQSCSISRSVETFNFFISAINSKFFQIEVFKLKLSRPMKRAFGSQIIRYISIVICYMFKYVFLDLGFCVILSRNKDRSIIPLISGTTSRRLGL